MGLFNFGRRNTPPTRFGYQPPAEALLLSWICSNKDCNQDGYQSELRQWPNRCPRCDTQISTFHLEEPWEHEARRVEIDSRIQHPQWELDGEIALVDNLLWYFEDALMKGDIAKATQQKNVVLTSPVPSFYNKSNTRSSLTYHALKYDSLDLAVEILNEWYDVSDISKPTDDNDWLTNGRTLVMQLINFLEHPKATSSSHYHNMFALLKNTVTSLGNNQLGGDQINSFVRIQHRINGTSSELDEMIKELKTFREKDRIIGIISNELPYNTPRRMEISAWSYMHAPSGIDTSLFMDVIFSPYLTLSQNDPQWFISKMADEIIPVGGWALDGAIKCILDVGPFENDQNYLDILDASLKFKKSQRISSFYLTVYELSRWRETHGEWN